jgi:phosphate transport system substrate-binding protein
MKFYLRQLIFIFAVLLLGGGTVTGFASANSKEILIVAGAGSCTGTMKVVAGAFQKKHTKVIVEVLPSIGSAGGIRAVTEGKIDIGLSARPLKQEERGAGIIEEPYGRTAFIFGVQASNPAKNVTLAEIEEIYAGKRKSWNDGTPVRLILRPIADTSSTYLMSINPDVKSASVKAHSIPGVFVGITDQDAAFQIEKTPGSFGITSAAIRKAEKRKIKPLSVDGVAPTLSNVLAGKYPYTMTMFLVYKRDKYGGAVKDFIEFVFSKDGRKLLSENDQTVLPRISGE